MLNKPTDEEVLAAIGSGSRMTYVVRAWLLDKYKGIKTDYVRRRLLKLEKEGKVERRPTVYVTQICWGRVAPKY